MVNSRTYLAHFGLVIITNITNLLHDNSRTNLILVFRVGRSLYASKTKLEKMSHLEKLGARPQNTHLKPHLDSRAESEDKM